MMKKKHKKNQGNSFIMVVATISFLAVLVAAILVAVALCYKLKAYDINSRDNFYYLEQAMDEIYAGVGMDSMKHLNKAYDETIEVIVYYDTQSESYITMKNDDANDLMKKTFIKLVKDDANYKNSTSVLAHLKSFLTNMYDSSTNPDGVQIAIGNLVTDEKSVSILNLVLKREATYSTVNSKTDGPNQETFVQTITTDLVINQPEFSVNFNTVGSDLADLYEFSIISDMGTEISGPTTVVTIAGNVYAAADFYNKSYNDQDATKVNSYTTKEMEKCNGLDSKSMYSGFYIDGAKSVKISAEKVIVPGSIAVMNSSNLSITNPNPGLATDIWADSIVLGGYSLKKGVKEEDGLQGSTLDMRANAYISDDLEVNAKASEFKLNGQYYGYNYASKDNRTYTDECVKANGNRTFTANTPGTIKDGATLDGQAHYNSSAIIVNGQDSKLDLSSVTDMYIAGQAYIELSKQTTTHSKVEKNDGSGDLTEFKVVNHNDKVEATTYDTYDYAEKTKDDFYTTNDNKKTTNLQDYRTGEAISMKSNQLAYLAPIPNSWITDDDTGIYLSINEKFYNDTNIFKDNWDNLKEIPLIKSVISGRVYYFFDFSQAKKTDNVMNQFIAAYSDLFEEDEVTGMSKGEKYGLTDITDYEHFKVKMLNVRTDNSLEESGFDAGKPKTSSIYSNSAISIKNGTSFTIKSSSSSIKPLIKAAKNINQNITEQNGNDKINENEQNPATLANAVTTKLQNQYQEVKWMLTAQSKDQNGITTAHTLEESQITPINYFFDLSKMDEDNEYIKLSSNYQIWLGKDDVHIKKEQATGGKVQGLIVCKGNVTFDTEITSFEGLIVAGGKVYINHDMSFSANEEIIKSILRECDQSQMYSSGDPDNHFKVCELFKLYQSIYKAPDGNQDVNTESMKSISAIQFEDILGFQNWKKNVD